MYQRTDKPRCGQPTAKGDPCKLPCYENADRCYHHLQLYPGQHHPDGRPSLLTPERADQLVAMLRFGNYLSVALRAVGISKDAWNDWHERARSERPEDQPYREFAERVAKAMAEGQVRHVATISRAAEKDWRAATWLLERQHPEIWGAVSVKVRTEAEAEAAAPEPEPVTIDDPFSEVDELAQRRRQHS